MPFSKRKLTWSEEVFAGLLILALVGIGLAAWFGLSRPTPQQTGVTEEGAASVLLTAEEKMTYLESMPQEDSASALTMEEKMTYLESMPQEDSTPTLTAEEKATYLETAPEE